MYDLALTQGLDFVEHSRRVDGLADDLGSTVKVLLDGGADVPLQPKGIALGLASVLEVGQKELAQLLLGAAGIVLVARVAAGIGLGIILGGEDGVLMHTLPVVETPAKRSADIDVKIGVGLSVDVFQWRRGWGVWHGLGHVIVVAVAMDEFVGVLVLVNFEAGRGNGDGTARDDEQAREEEESEGRRDELHDNGKMGDDSMG